MKTVDVWCEDNQNRHNRAEGLHALDHVATADLLNEFFEKPKRQLLGNHVRHEKCAPLRLVDTIQSLGEFRLYLGTRKITGKLFPERHIRGFEQFEDFSRQYSLSKQASFFCKREFGWIAPFHKTRKHFFQQRRTRSELFVETVFDETGDRVVETVRQRERSSAVTCRAAIAVANVFQKFLRGIGRWCFRISGSGKLPAVII